MAYAVSAKAPNTADSDDVAVSTVRLVAVMVFTLALCATVVGAYVAVLSN